MIQRETVDGLDAYTIASKNNLTKATFIPEKGGKGVSIIMPGHNGPRELLFHRPKHSEGGWPFCFPICGRIERQGKLNSYFYDGHIYELPIHGFAAHKPWTVADSGADHLLMTLRDDDQTRQAYPFHFTVELLYEIADKRLFCRQTYTNHGDRPMPYYAGFHPYFLTPPPGQGKDHVILNFRPEKRFRYNQQLSDLVGEQALFALPISAANPEIHEQLLSLGEDKNIHLTFPEKDRVHLIAEGVEDPDLFPYVQIYSPMDQPFIAIEPWMSYANALNNLTGVRWLAPGQSEHGLLRLWME